MTDTYMNHYDDDRPERNNIDFSRICLLLMVIKEAVLHGSAFTNIIAEANFELLAINAGALVFANERQKAKLEAEAKEENEPQPISIGMSVEPGPDATMTTAPERRL